MEFNLVEKIEKDVVASPEVMAKFFLLFFEIAGTDTFIKDSPSFPGSTEKIIRNELVSAIGATLSIEGTMLDKEEIEESFQKADQGEVLRRKEQEAENSRQVYNFIRRFVRDHKQGFEYSEPLIKQIHKYFTDNMNYVSNVPGEYRGDFNVSFGDPRKDSLCRTRSEIQEAMKKFSVWLNTKKDGFLSSNTFVNAMMAHYYLTEIHPFVDGNGRTARALEALILNARGVNDYCFWSWANFWSAHKDQYLAHLHNIRMTLDPTDFILWGLDGYKNEIENIKGRVLKKVKQLMFSDYTHYLLRNKKNEKIKINQRIFDTLQLLIPTGRIPFKKFLSTPQVIALYRSVAESTRVRDFQKMVSQNLIKIGKSNSDSEDFIEPNFEILDRVRYFV
jgi:Fic family protein